MDNYASKALANGIVFTMALTGPANLQAAPIVYALTAPGNGFGAFDLALGVFTATGSLTGITDIARRPGGTLLGVDDAFTWSASTPSRWPKRPSTSLRRTLTLAIRDNGELFGASHNALYRIDSTTGATSFVGVMGQFNPGGFQSAQVDSAGQLFLLREDDSFTLSTLYGVNTTSGQATPIGSGVGYKVTATHLTGGVLYGFTFDRHIISINTSTGAGTPLVSLDVAFRVLAFATGPDQVDNADFDADGDVDGGDFLRWQRGVGAGTATPATGDANGDGNVTGADLAIWKLQFGPAVVKANAPVAEPSTFAIATVAILSVRAFRRRRPRLG